jgi:hypothetical protein
MTPAEINALIETVAYAIAGLMVLYFLFRG